MSHELRRPRPAPSLPHVQPRSCAAPAPLPPSPTCSPAAAPPRSDPYKDLTFLHVSPTFLHASQGAC
jgi:hypothetical protein